MTTNKWEIWLAKVPFEEDLRKRKKRPVLVLDEDEVIVLSFKLTSHTVRSNYLGEYAIIKWREAGLMKPSVIRCSQLLRLRKRALIRKLGKLQLEDIEGVKGIVKRELPEYSHLVEKLVSNDNLFIPDDDPMFDGAYFSFK